MVVAVAEPLSTLPQIYEIWIRHKSEGVSVLSWSLFAIAALVWLLYGLKIKDNPVIISSSLWVVTEVVVVAGVLLN